MDVTYICISLLAVVFFLLMNAFFVVAEFAIVRVRKSQIEIAVEQGKKGAKNALLIVKNVNAYLSACQLGITLASLALGWLGEPVFAALIRPIFSLFNAPEWLISTISVAIGYFLMTTLHVVVGELIPKSMAIFSTESYALHTATALMWFYKITYPIMWLFNTITNGVVKLLGHNPEDEHDVYTGDEIKLLVDESTEFGLIDPDQNEYVDNVLDLSVKDAEAIMTPRTDIVFLDINDSTAENLEKARQYSFSRYPVCDGDADHLLGFVHVKDLIDLDENTDMHDWNIREIPAVPVTCSLSNMIDELSRERTQICAVVDEHGGTAGIATLTDVLEQIVGKIDDEYRHNSAEDLKVQDDGTFDIDGGMPIKLFCDDVIGFWPEGAHDVETVAGLTLKLMDKIPDEGESVVFKGDKGGKITTVKLKVKLMDKVRVDKLSVSVVIDQK